MNITKCEFISFISETIFFLFDADIPHMKADMSKKKGFAICKCIFERNIFLKHEKLHVTYQNDEQFLSDYSSKIKNIYEAIEEARQEAIRRIKASNEIIERRDIIRKNFKAFYPDVYCLNKTIFSKDFLSLPDSTKSVTQIGKGLFTFPVFTKDFCEKLVSELKYFKNQDLPHRQPNSMNKHGILLDDILEFNEFFDELRIKYLQPITNKLFPNMKDVELDSHKGNTK